MSVRPIDQQISALVREMGKFAKTDVPRATNSALNKTAKRISTRIVKGVAKTEKLPNKVIKRKTFVRGSKVKTQKARLRVYRSDVSVISLLSAGTIAAKMGTGTNRKGVRAKGRTFNGAFINQANGTAQVFRRIGRARTPLEVVKIPIHQTVDRISPVVARRVMKTDFFEITRQELNHRLQKRRGN